MNRPVDIFSSPLFGDRAVDAPIVTVIKLFTYAAKLVGQGFMNALSVNINLR